MIRPLLACCLSGLVSLTVGAEAPLDGASGGNAGAPSSTLPRSGTGSDQGRRGPDSGRSGLAVVGRWREVGRDATLELRLDGSFTAVDNEGLEVSGRYALTDDRTLRFEIQQEGVTQDVVPLEFSIQGDDLTLAPADNRGVERYRRQP